MCVCGGGGGGGGHSCPVDTFQVFFFFFFFFFFVVFFSVYFTGFQKDRIILRSDFHTPSERMFKELGWSSVPNRIKYNKAVHTYRALNNLTPEYISQLLQPMSQVHSLKLRSSENGSLYVPESHTSLHSGCFSCLAPRLWDALP